MKPRDFIKQVADPAARKPLYVLAGGEPAAVARCLKAAEEAAVPEFRDFNFQVLDLEAGQAGRLTAEASTGAFFAPPRVLVAKNPPFTGEDWNLLADYLDDPSENLIVLALDKVDARLKFFKKIRSAGLEVDCQPPKGGDLVRWLAEEFRLRGVTAAPAVARLVIDRAGGDPRTLLGEAEKLSLYLGPGQTLTADLVRRLVSLTPEANVFELGEALGRHDLQEGLRILLELLATEPDRAVLAMMIRHFRLLLKIKTRQSSLNLRRLGREEAADLGIHPFVLEKLQGQAAAWSWREVARALAALEEAGRTLVTSPVPPAVVLEELSLALGRQINQL